MHFTFLQRIIINYIRRSNVIAFCTKHFLFFPPNETECSRHDLKNETFHWKLQLNYCPRVPSSFFFYPRVVALLYNRNVSVSRSDRTAWDSFLIRATVAPQRTISALLCRFMCVTHELQTIRGGLSKRKNRTMTTTQY